MNFYHAIIQAAELIDRHPELFDFYTSDIPEGQHCGSPGCAIGWVGFFAGMKRGTILDDIAQEMGTDEIEFYDRMDTLAENWEDKPHACAKGLRLYAEQYHSHERQVA